jgi:hypothetical protein
MARTPDDEIARYLSSGKHDALFAAWPVNNLLACARNGENALRQALIAAVTDRGPTPGLPDDLARLNAVEFARKKVGPMVRGLFPPTDRPAVLEMLSRSIVFLTPNNIRSVLATTPFFSTAWDLANPYLLSLGAEPLSNDAPEAVGLSEGTTCYVSTAYFQRESRFGDFVVHEVAHVFHNCKRETIGLSRIRSRE